MELFKKGDLVRYKGDAWAFRKGAKGRVERDQEPGDISVAVSFGGESSLIVYPCVFDLEKL